MPTDLVVGDGTLEIIRGLRLLGIKESQKTRRKIEQIAWIADWCQLDKGPATKLEGKLQEISLDTSAWDSDPA